MAQEQKQAPGQWRAGQLGATKIVYPQKCGMSRKKTSRASPPRARQRFAAALALPYNEDYMGRRRSCSTSALPHTRLRQVARLGVTHGFFCRPSALFCALRGERVDGPQSASPAHHAFPHLAAVRRWRRVASFLRTSRQLFSSRAAHPLCGFCWFAKAIISW
jgi:hypothetical protein